MQTVELPFTTLDIHKGYVVGRTKEGVHLSLEDHLQVLEILNKYLISPYGFIVDEVNSYSVDFKVMMHMSKDENICCIGVTYHRMVTKISLEVGQFIIKKPIYFSNNIDEVTNWVKEQIAC